MNLISGTGEKSKELVTEVDPLSPELVHLESDPPVADRHADFRIVSTDRIISSYVNSFYNPDLVSLCLGSMNCGSASTATAAVTVAPWFFVNEPRKCVNILAEAPEPRAVTNLFNVQGCVWFSGVRTIAFDPGGTLVVCVVSVRLHFASSSFDDYDSVTGAQERRRRISQEVMVSFLFLRDLLLRRHVLLCVFLL